MKLVFYGERNPLDQPDIDSFGTMFDINSSDNKLNPIPYSGSVPVEQGCELRIWIPGGRFRNNAYVDNRVVFQFIYHNEVALIRIGDKSKVRHYEVMSEIIKTFQGRSIGTLGKLDFEGEEFKYFTTGSPSYGMYQITAKMMTL